MEFQAFILILEIAFLIDVAGAVTLAFRIFVDAQSPMATVSWNG